MHAIDQEIVEAIRQDSYQGGIDHILNKGKTGKIDYVDAACLRMFYRSTEAGVIAQVYSKLETVLGEFPDEHSKFQMAASMAEISSRAEPNYKPAEVRALLDRLYGAISVKEPGELFLYSYYTAALYIPDMFNLPYIELTNAQMLAPYIKAHELFGDALAAQKADPTIGLWHLVTLAEVARQNIILSILGSDFLGGMDPAMPYVCSLDLDQIDFKSVMSREDMKFREYRKQYEQIRPRGKGSNLLVPDSALKQPQ